MQKIDRLVGIILLLQSKKVVRAEDIAEHFGVSVRTTYRDINALCEAGVPIAGEAGVGYSLVSGYTLPPVMFSEEEASALVMGAEFVRHVTDESLVRHLDSALLKIRAVLPQAKKEYLERLQSSIAVFTRPAGFSSTVGEDVLTSLQQAIVYRKVLRVRYQARESENPLERDIEPLNLIYYSNHWHIIAYCRLRKDFRDFRADRVQHLLTLTETFPERPDFSLMNYLQRQYEIQNPQEVRIEAVEPAIRYMASQKYFYGFVDETPFSTGERTGVQMRFIVPSLRWILSWLMSFGTSIRVLSPTELCAMMHHEALTIAAQYSTLTEQDGHNGYSAHLHTN